MIWRIAGAVIALALIYSVGQLAWRGLHLPGPGQTVGALTSVVRAAADVRAPAVSFKRRTLPVSTPSRTALLCAPAPRFATAAAQNAVSVRDADWSVFGRSETGWAIYAPLAAHEIGTSCTPADDGFAAALADWQRTAHLASDGIMTEGTLKAMGVAWLRRRPFAAATAHGACPPAPDPDRLVWMDKDEGYSGKPVQLRPGALAAYRAMVTAARTEEPAIGADHRLLTVFSGYRDPVSDAARCAKDGNCGTIAKANCSAHRTGMAMDLYLGAAPGFAPESSANPNRLYQAQSPAYRWLAANAPRFGFVPYPFEPWHWEWTGEPI